MGFVNSCWPFGQQLYKLNIAEILKQTQEAVENAEEAVEAAKKLQTGSVVSVNEIAPDENGNVEIPGFSVNQRCAQSLDFKGYWDGKTTKDFAINMGFKEAGANADLSSQLHTFPVWLSGAYTIHGIPFSTSFAYAFGDPISSSKDIVVVNPAEGEIVHFYLDGDMPKSEVINGSSGNGGGSGGEWKLIGEVVSDGSGDLVGIYVPIDFTQYKTVFITVNTAGNEQARLVLSKTLAWYNGTVVGWNTANGQSNGQLIANQTLMQCVIENINGELYPFTGNNTGLAGGLSSMLPQHSPRADMTATLYDYVRFDTNNNGAVSEGVTLTVWGCK